MNDCATFSKSLNPWNIDKAFRISGSVSGSRLKAVFGYPYLVANSILLKLTASPWTTEASARWQFGALTNRKATSSNRAPSTSSLYYYQVALSLYRDKWTTIIRLWWLWQWLVTYGHHLAVTIYLHVAPSTCRHTILPDIQPENRIVEVFGLWFSWVRIQFCFANFESESNPDPEPTRFKQSYSCLSPGKYKSTKQTVTFFLVNTKSKSNPDPASGKKTSLLILLEAAGVRIQKIRNPVHAHLCRTVIISVRVKRPVLCGYRNLIIRSAPKNLNSIRIRSWSENFAQNIIRSRSENPKPSSYQTPITITIFLPYLLNLVII